MFGPHDQRRLAKPSSVYKFLEDSHCPEPGWKGGTLEAPIAPTIFLYVEILQTSSTDCCLPLSQACFPVPLAASRNRLFLFQPMLSGSILPWPTLRF